MFQKVDCSSSTNYLELGQTSQAQFSTWLFSLQTSATSLGVPRLTLLLTSWLYIWGFPLSHQVHKGTGMTQGTQEKIILTVRTSQNKKHKGKVWKGPEHRAPLFSSIDPGSTALSAHQCVQSARKLTCIGHPELLLGFHLIGMINWIIDHMVSLCLPSPEVSEISCGLKPQPSKLLIGLWMWPNPSTRHLFHINSGVVQGA